jgi:hypothetical protein
MTSSRSFGVAAVAFLMIAFGAAEVATSITHEFFGRSVAPVAVASFASAAVGILYAAAGLLLLLMKRWAALLAIALLVGTRNRVAKNVWLSGAFPGLTDQSFFRLHRKSGCYNRSARTGSCSMIGLRRGDADGSRLRQKQPPGG